LSVGPYSPFTRKCLRLCKYTLFRSLWCWRQRSETRFFPTARLVISSAKFLSIWLVGGMWRSVRRLICLKRRRSCSFVRFSLTSDWKSALERVWPF
jgi:hypothetical protein